MSCGVGCRHGSDLELLWLWCRLVATALIRPLAWEPPYAAGVALEKDKKTNQKNKPKNLDQLGLLGHCYLSEKVFSFLGSVVSLQGVYLILRNFLWSFR